MNIPEVTPVAVGALSVIARVCQDLGIADTLNAMLDFDEKQCKVTPGTLLVALVVNGQLRIDCFGHEKPAVRTITSLSTRRQIAS